jgi:hypothetical protein
MIDLSPSQDLDVILKSLRLSQKGVDIPDFLANLV